MEKDRRFRRMARVDTYGVTIEIAKTLPSPARIMPTQHLLHLHSAPTNRTIDQHAANTVVVVKQGSYSKAVPDGEDFDRACL
jgi:hypothetical protein